MADEAERLSVQIQAVEPAEPEPADPELEHRRRARMLRNFARHLHELTGEWVIIAAVIGGEMYRASSRTELGEKRESCGHG